MWASDRFQSTLPAWGETKTPDAQRSGDRISIHSPRMGRDTTGTLTRRAVVDFNPLSPHGERHVVVTHTNKAGAFQSTLPAWGETDLAGYLARHGIFQSTLPAWGETGRPGKRACDGDFNPLSPHGERPTGKKAEDRKERFQSTLPAWGETKKNSNGSVSSKISIHSPRMGRDPHTRPVPFVPPHFNPLSPHGERRCWKTWRG